MSSNSEETELTPPLEPTDISFLKTLNQGYQVTDIPRLHVDKFRERYLPNLARDQGEKNNRAALVMWEKEVQPNIRLPVYIVNDQDEILYTVPPWIGTGPTRFTGNKKSIETQLRGVTMIRNRFQHQGELAYQEALRAIPVKADTMIDWRLEWYRILVDFGYMEPIDGLKVSTKPGAKAIHNVVDDVEPDYVDDDDD